jgi:GTPase
MIDLVKLTLIAGDGGHGRVAFRREKYVPKGGPDGGMGGDGGSIILKGDKGLNTLKHFSGTKQFAAEVGQLGGKKKQRGHKGENMIIRVPLGTVVWLVAENQASKFHRERKSGQLLIEKQAELKEHDEEPQLKADLQKLQQLVFDQFNKSDVSLEKYYLEQEGQRIPPLEPDEISLRWKEADGNWGVEAYDVEALTNLPGKELDAIKNKSLKIVEILEHDQEVVLCQGGFGGRGSHSFKSSRNTTPLEAEYASFGERKEVVLELRILADVGLVGLPNAGKSTFLSVITKANPKIANYPFTTIEPNLGVLSDRVKGQDRSLVVADIPGLIEGASQGKGLGHQFLRHIENCGALVYVLFLEESIIFDQAIRDEEKSAMLWKQFVDLKAELKAHNPQLLHKKYIVTLNKVDLYKSELIELFIKFFKQKDVVLMPFSAVTKENLGQVSKQIFKQMDLV